MRRNSFVQMALTGRIGVRLTGGGQQPIAVTSPVAYQTFQRNGSDQADIVITGTYNGAPTAIEASFNGGAYATIDASPSGGTFSGTLSAQAAGQGTLTVRYTNDTDVSATVPYVGIGDVFLVAFAQSNAVGNLTTPNSYSHASLRAAMFREDGVWRELADQTDSDRTDDGSVWPLIATLHMADQGVPVAFVTTADGSTTIVDPGEWQSGGSAYANAVSVYNASGVNDIAAILGWLGETDAINGNAQADYQTDLAAALDAMQTSLSTSAPLILAMTGYVGAGLGATRSELDAIRAAQIYLWANDADIHAGPTGHDIGLSGGDGVHYESDADGQTMANRWWRAIDAALFGGSESARGPQFVSAAWVDAAVRVTFSGGVGNLANVTDTTGWRFTDDGTEIAVTAAAAYSTNAVDLTLASYPTGTQLLSFASYNDAAGATLADSGTYPLPPEPFVGQSVTGTPPSSGDTLTLQPDATAGKDTLLYEAAPNNDYGAFDRVHAGLDATGNAQRSLIGPFDLSSLPGGATITAATLTLYCVSEEVTTDRNISVHRALTQWYEGTQNNAAAAGGVDASTWNYRNHNGSVAWGAAGGQSGTDYAASATDTVLITDVSTAYDFDVLADVQAWYAGTATNYGWWIIGDEANNGSIKRFASSDSATAGQRPKLVIEYTT